MWNSIKLGLVLVLGVMLLVFSVDTKAQTKPLPTATRTRTASLTQTSTKTSTSTITFTKTQTPTASSTVTSSPTVTESATSTETLTATVTPSSTTTHSPTVTPSPTPTPVQKTEIKVFDSVSLYPGQKVTSQIYDISKYAEVVIFLSTRNGQPNTGTCFFIPNGGFETDRYVGITVTATTGSGGFEQVIATSEVLGPKMVCEVSNKQYGSIISFFVYLIP